MTKTPREKENKIFSNVIKGKLCQRRKKQTHPAKLQFTSGFMNSHLFSSPKVECVNHCLLSLARVLAASVILSPYLTFFFFHFFNLSSSQKVNRRWPLNKQLLSLLRLRMWKSRRQECEAAMLHYA